MSPKSHKDNVKRYNKAEESPSRPFDTSMSRPAMTYSNLLEKIERPSLQRPCDVKLLGYDELIAQLRRQIATLENFIVSGPSGVGKTTVIRRISEDTSRTFMYIDASWMRIKQFGEPEVQIGALVREAIAESPTIIFLDKIESICGRKRQSDLTERVYTKLEGQLEELRETAPEVLVIAATDQPEVLDPQITKFFSKEIRFPTPSRADRVEMLQFLFPFSRQEIDIIADKTHCHLFGDLKRLRSASLDENLRPNFATVLKTLESDDFKPVLKNPVTPFNHIKWRDVGGVNSAKKELMSTVIKPLRDKERFERFSSQKSRGALLYGPPGCAKTMLAQALATESGYNFIAVKGPELMSKWVGDSEAAVRRLYRNARQIAPCIIFFDEIDGFATERTDSQNSSVGDKVVTQLLTEFNGPSDDVFTIAATNRPERLDSALLRPGRLDSLIYIPLPSRSDRVEIFKVHITGGETGRPLPVRFDMTIDEVAQVLAERTPGYSGADISKVCRVATKYAFEEEPNIEFVEFRHFEDALKDVDPSTTPKQMASYEKFHRRTRQGRRRAESASESIKKSHERMTFLKSFKKRLNLK